MYILIQVAYLGALHGCLQGLEREGFLVHGIFG